MSTQSSPFLEPMIETIEKIDGYRRSVDREEVEADIDSLWGLVLEIRNDLAEALAAQRIGVPEYESGRTIKPR